MPHDNYTAERGDQLLLKSFQAGDRIMVCSSYPGVYFVSSQSRPWKIHAVDFNTEEICDCESSLNRGECRHAVRVAWSIENKRRQKQGLPLVPAPVGFRMDGTPERKEKAA
jgi:hypothetical protein